MKGSIKKIFFPVSILDVLSPFVYFHNLCGICIINHRSKNFKVSKFAVGTFVVNFIVGCKCIGITSSIGIINTRDIEVLGYGVTIMIITAVASAFISVLLNVFVRNHLRNLFRALMTHDAHAKSIYTFNHRSQFLILLIMWTMKHAYLFTKSLKAAQNSFRPIIINIYISISMNIGSTELCYMILILVAIRVHSLSNSLKEIDISKKNCDDYNIKARLKTVLILLNQIFSIVELMSKCFGLQMMVFYLSAALVGMFTVFTGLENIFNKGSYSTYMVFDFYKDYTLYNHVSLIIVCAINSFINQQVRKIIKDKKWRNFIH